MHRRDGSPQPSAQSARLLGLALLLSSLVFVLPGPGFAQAGFVAVSDSTNPIVTNGVSGAYTGAAWVDVDDDGWLDLFMVRKAKLFRNLGGGTFGEVAGVVTPQGSALGCTWADYDADGDIDVYVSGGPSVPDRGSMLFRNDGGFDFNRIVDGDVGDAFFNSGWGTSFGDIDADGYPDIVVAAANGFSGVFHENRLLYNNGDGTFTNVDSTVVTDSLDAHTIPTWSDYDLDGDIDLFIGSGQVSSLSPDNHFRNVLTESGSWGFDRITTAPIATDFLDGQVWNWIDYDNDGDLDAFQTNYTASLANNLYRNNGPGTYEKMTSGQVGTIVSDANAGLANLWTDFDNDGDLDCFVTNDGAATNDFYLNDGDGSFTQDFASAVVQEIGPHYGATAGDWDNDGDVDLYVHGTTATKRLYRNDLGNGNHWINIKLTGDGPPAGSNTSALGAQVRAKATIDGTPTWQFREVSAQNSFNSMNMLNVHFGFGNAVIIDSLEVTWPAGGVDTYTLVPVDLFLQLTEGVNPTDVAIAPRPGPVLLRQNSPNPFAVSTSIEFELERHGRVTLDVYDLAGRRVQSLVNAPREAGAHRVVWDGRDAAGRPVAAGVYLVRLQSADGLAEPLTEARRMVRLR